VYIAAIVAAYLFFSFRLFQFVDRYAASLFFWDQWDFLRWFFLEEPPWKVFLWQQGHVREGLGFIPLYWGLTASSWDAVAIANSVGWILVFAGLLALWLKHRLFGCLSPWDVVIPLLFLNLGQYEALVSASNPAHSALPLLMLMAYALLLTARRRRIVYLGLLGLNFFMIFTGYGFFLGLITPPLLLFEILRRGEGAPVATGFLSACLVLSIASLLVFFVGYDPGTDPTCFPPQLEHAWNYPAFASLMFNRVLGLGKSGPLAVLGGLVLLVVLLAVLVANLRWLGRAPNAARPLVILVLLAFSLLFAGFAGFGRACFSVDDAYRSRYVTLLLPAYLALYFSILGIERARLRNSVVAAFVLTVGVCELRPKPNDVFTAAAALRGRSAWALCYVEHEDVRLCNRKTRFLVHPEPQRTQLRERLRFLRERQLNLYDEAQRARTERRLRELEEQARSAPARLRRRRGGGAR
jgi:hypothetical protein